MSMDFVRSSILAGKNVDRLLAATIRGAVRRNDADGGSLVPYFPSIITKTLNISTETGSYSVTFTGNGIATVIADINAALTTHGAAYDADGVVAIQTSVNGGGGWIEVTGGSGASILGFDLNLGRRLVSVGGDLPSAPEGRIGNSLGTMFPGKGDDFKMGVFQRPLAALGNNLDVLYADDARQDVEVGYLGAFTATSGEHVYLGASNRVYNGLDAEGARLTRLSSVHDISPYFFLTDPTTHRRLPNYVIAVILGDTGTPTYTEASTSSQTGRNVLGNNISKFGPISITSITEGHVIECAGIGSAASVGDFVGISGATNLSPWSNNGIRWVVDSTIGTDRVSVRAASQAELRVLGATAPQDQLQTSLNGTASGLFGSATLYMGPYVSGVSLIISPALTNGTQVHVWAGMPLSHREKKQTASRLPTTSTPQVFQNLFTGPSSSYPAHLAARRYSNSDQAPLLSLQDETGAYMLRVTSDGYISSSQTGFGVTGGGFSLTGSSGAGILSGSSSLTLSSSAGGVGVSALSNIQLSTAGVARWEIGSDGVLRGLHSSADLKKNAGTALNVGTQDNFVLNLLVNNTAQWSIDTSGNLNGSISADQFIQKASGALYIKANGGTGTDAVFVNSFRSGVGLNGYLGITLTSTNTDITFSTNIGGPRGWKLDGATGKLVATLAGSSIIQGLSGLTLNDGSSNILVGDGSGNVTVSGSGVGTLTGVGAGGVVVSATGAAGTVLLKTNGSTRWTVDASGNFVAPAAATIQTTSGGLTLTGASTASLTASSGDASISGSTNLNFQIGGSTKWRLTGSGGDIDGRVASTLQAIGKSTSGGLYISYSGGGNSNLQIGTTAGSGGIVFSPGGATSWTIAENGTITNSGTGTLQMNSQKITGLASPTFGATEAATAVYVDKHTVLSFGFANGNTTNTGVYVPVGYSKAAAGSLDNVIQAASVPYACTFQGIVASCTAGPTGGSETFTVYKLSAGTQTSLVANVTFTGGGAAVASDFAHTASLAQGDSLFIYRTGSGTIGAASSQVTIALICSG